MGGRGRIGVEDKRKEGKQRRKRRQCKARGLPRWEADERMGWRQKEGGETKEEKEAGYKTWGGKPW